MFKKVSHIHFVGIGGIGMSGIAEVLANLGYKVSGSDLKESENTRRLSSLGINCATGHRAENVQGADVVVYSSAVSQDNLEINFARANSIPVIRRAEMLAELMRLKYGVAVAGTHGKTTTTSMIAALLAKGGFDPTAVIGGVVKSTGSNAKLGNGDFMVAEADESDGSFLKLTPTVAVVTTIDEEHLDYYAGIRAIKKAFLEFVNKVPFYGFAVVCLDEKHIRSILPRVEKRYLTYGLSSRADYRAREITPKGLRTTYIAERNKSALGAVTINMPGVHHVKNSLAAITVALELDIPFKAAAEALEEFSGIHRRFEIKGEVEGIVVVDDYGHHPAEIRATLRAARDAFGRRRLIVVFQPHRYTRTRALFNEFCTSFSSADALLLLDIYPAGEKPIEGVSSRLLCEGIKGSGPRDSAYVQGKEAAIDRLMEMAVPGDVVMTLGAGDVYRVGEAFLPALARRA